MVCLLLEKCFHKQYVLKCKVGLYVPCLPEYNIELALWTVSEQEQHGCGFGDCYNVYALHTVVLINIILFCVPHIGFWLCRVRHRCVKFSIYFDVLCLFCHNFLNSFWDINLAKAYAVFLKPKINSIPHRVFKSVTLHLTFSRSRNFGGSDMAKVEAQIYHHQQSKQHICSVSWCTVLLKKSAYALS